MVQLTALRPAGQNPRQEVREMASLLWRDEALAVVKAIAPERVRSRSTREELCELIASSGPICDVRRWVVEGLKGRFEVKVPPAPLRRAMSAA